MRETIEVFTGNRAEFGILSPLIEAFSELYNVNLIISGAHLVDTWGTKTEVISKVKEFKSANNIKIIELLSESESGSYHYTGQFPLISENYIKYNSNLNEEIKFSLILGDRIETASFAFTAMYLDRVIVHICGGDYGNLSCYDHNIRHAITKVSHIHFVTNERSFDVVKQLGEEEWRIFNVGMPSLDVIKQSNTPDKEELKVKYNLQEDDLILCTYHPVNYISPEVNLEAFREVIDALSAINKKVILTYPNNDPGYELLIKEIEKEVPQYKNITVIKNLGISNYIGLLKELNVILLGNSSSILTESSFFQIPSLLLGNRQKDRFRGENVTEIIDFKKQDIIDYVEKTFTCYSDLKSNFESYKYIYGDGKSSIKAVSAIDAVFKSHSRNRMLEKYFIQR